METLELNDEKNAVEVLKAIQACVRLGIEVKLAIDGKLMARVVAGAEAPAAIERLLDLARCTIGETLASVEAPVKTKAK